MSEAQIKHIVHEIGRVFRTFGGGTYTANNPVSHALKDKPLQFAAGVDVEEVVKAVLSIAKATE